MKFYTIQTLDFWNNNKNKKYLSNDSSFIFEEFKDAYTWMHSQLKKRLPKSDNSMIWVWKDKPDIRRVGHHNKGVECVLLQIELDESEVLISDFDLWHCVLNKYTIEKYDDELIWMEDSWERIFDLRLCAELNEVKLENLLLQGVVSRVNINKVKLLKKFTAK